MINSLTEKNGPFTQDEREYFVSRKSLLQRTAENYNEYEEELEYVRNEI